jgi:hypothetical protein
VFVPTPVQPPDSPRVRELSQRIQQVITDFQHQYPMTPGEIRQALLHAAGSAGGTRRPLLAAVAGGIAAVLGITLFAAQAGGRGGEAAGFPVVLALGVFAALLAIVVAIRRSR